MNYLHAIEYLEKDKSWGGSIRKICAGKLCLNEVVRQSAKYCSKKCRVASQKKRHHRKKTNTGKTNGN